jgi:hypothetical protein
MLISCIVEDGYDLILSEAENVLGGEPVDKCLIYAPDTIGHFLFEEYVDWFDPARASSRMRRTSVAERKQRKS